MRLPLASLVPLALLSLSNAACRRPSEVVADRPASAPSVASSGAAPAAAPIRSALAPVGPGSSGAPSAPAPLASQPREKADAARKASEACWADLGCSIDEAERRTREAVVAGGSSCLAAYYGHGMPVDRSLARACLARHAREEGPCKNDSASTERLVYAIMLADGQAGPADPDAAKALVTSCIEDTTLGTFLSVIEPHQPGRGIDFCDGVATTTMSLLECALLQGRGSEFAARAAEKRLAAGLDAKGRDLLTRTLPAWEKLSMADGSLAGDAMRGGTGARQIATGQQGAVNKLRAQAAARLAAAADVDAGAAAALKEARAALLEEADKERQALLADDDAAWAKVKAACGALAAHTGGAAARKAAESWVDRKHAEAFAEHKSLFR